MSPSKNAEREARAARERLRRYNARQSVHAHRVRRRRRDNIIATVAVIVVAAVATVTQVLYFSAGPGAPLTEPSTSATPAATSNPSPTPTQPGGENVGDIPDPSAAEARAWTGSLTLNDIQLGFELDGAAAPQAVAAFVQQVDDGYFVGKTCHRLTTGPAKLIQCGSLTGNGAGDPEYMFGPIENAPSDGIYPAGTIALARAGGAAYSQGHQFFVMLADGAIPNDSAGGYTVFGTVTSGLDQLISEIADAGTADGSTDGAPAVATTITAVTVQ